MCHRCINIIKRVTRTDSDALWVFRSRSNRRRLETLHGHKDTRKTPAKDSETFDRNEVSVQHALPFLKTNVCEISVTWRKWMWSSVCESCSSSAFLLLRSSISCSSRFSCSSARLTSAFSWSLISCVTSERLLSMEWIRSVKILILSSTAACAERC